MLEPQIKDKRNLAILEEIKNKRGSLMVEAALIYPLILLAVMALIYMMISMYGAAAIKADMHISQRQEALDITKTGQPVSCEGEYLNDKYVRSAFGVNINFSEIRVDGKKAIRGTAAHRFHGGSLIDSVADVNFESVWYLIDEVKYMAAIDLLALED